MTRSSCPSGLALLLVGAALATTAGDPPHGSHVYPYTDGSAATQDIGCTTAGADKGCHDTHGALGGVLTNALANANLCQSCHAATLQAAGKPVHSPDAASPEMATGVHHAFGVPCTNAAAGSATPAAGSPLNKYVTGFGNQTVCSTCHSMHSPAAGAGSQTALPPAKLQGAGSGTVSVGTVAAAAAAKAYLLEFVTGGAVGTARFRLSNDNGVSWWGWNGSMWVAYDGSNGRLTGAGVPLNDGSNVTVNFAGSFSAAAPPDRWGFYISYPLLRVALDSGDNAAGAKFCRDCHDAWTMDPGDLEDADGVKVMGHPVGILLNANARNYDRPAPLDGNGQAQAGDRDSNPTNDLKLDPGNRVQCYTCHGLHYADSNTTSVDGP